jgi:hypothetical protein
MPSFSIKLSQSQAEDLTTICGLGAHRLNALAEALSGKTTIRRSELRRIIASVVDDEKVVRALSRVFLGLAFAIRSQRRTSADLMKALDEALRSPDLKGVPDPLLWHECAPIIEQMITSPSVMLSTKARDLAEDFERALISARILTDVRPVYNHADDIVGAEIIQTLRIEFDSRADKNTGTISFGLDLEDIKHLLTACERALKKAEAANTLMRAGLGDEVLVLGETI